MKVEAYFRFGGNDTSIAHNAIHKANKSLTGFLSNIPDNWGYAFREVEGDIWCLSGDAVFMFKVLSILAEQEYELSDIIAVDTYTNNLEYLRIKDSPTYKFRFVTPYYLNVFDKESKEILQEKDGPYTFKMAKEIKSFLENGNDIFDDADENKGINDMQQEKEVIVDIVKGIPGIEFEKGSK